VSKERRLFTREFKLMALSRFAAAPNALDLARELGIRRELLYKWQAKYEAGGEEALRTSGRPRPVAAAPEALAEEQRIAALERKLGQQELLLDFFEGALRRIEGSRRAIAGPGATASSPRSKR
jgi:transposase-like protein